MPSAIEPERLIIRSIEPSDAHAVSSLMGMPGVFENLLQLPDMPVASRVEGLQRHEPRACHLIALVDGDIVAQASLHAPPPSVRRQHVRSLGMAVAPAWQHRGIGRQLLTRLLAWADGWAGVLRVELLVYADNAPAIGLYRQLGFVEEGRHRGHTLRAGVYVETLSMARLHPAPPVIG